MVRGPGRDVGLVGSGDMGHGFQVTSVEREGDKVSYRAPGAGRPMTERANVPSSLCTPSPILPRKLFGQPEISGLTRELSPA